MTGNPPVVHAGGCCQPRFKLAVIVLARKKINEAYVLNKKDRCEGAVQRQLYTLQQEKTTSVVTTPRPRVLRTQWRSGIIEDTISGLSRRNGSGILKSKFYSA
jgi:hypothetical protein